MSSSANTPEHRRLREKYSGSVDPWRKWGPYVSERAWGSVREDYSADGNAWNSLTHDMARSKAYRWGEDGIAALCDRYQVLVFALALWNGRDPILKERMFGLTCDEGNHGEDVKEYWFYLDSTPTHSYMRMLYKYPHAEFPYAQLVEENRRRSGGNQPEYELLDTGIFEQNRYFDVFVEYAKVSEEDIAIRIEAINRGPEAATLHLLPHLWFRNTWGWTDPRGGEPIIQLGSRSSGSAEPLCLVADDTEAGALANLQFSYKLGCRFLYAPADGTALFTNNESNAIRLHGASTNPKPFVKDGFHRHVIHGEASIEPAQRGTKSCVWYERSLASGESWTLRLRLAPHELENPLKDVDATITTRRADADEFYEAVHPPKASAEDCRIQRQALAGMLWSKVFYYWDVDLWLNGDNPKFQPPDSRKRGR
ncbi:MAG: MGH1-like glycoside hydrolase domain-containing protein, partial [Terriglobales bacterium]